jgi:hypothetical protein
MHRSIAMVHECTLHFLCRREADPARFVAVFVVGSSPRAPCDPTDTCPSTQSDLAQSRLVVPFAKLSNTIYDVYIIIILRLAMRTLVDIPDEQIEDLTAICESKKVSRAEVIRQAISFYIGANRRVPADAFGLWKAARTPVDGLAYQEQARSEW